MAETQVPTLAFAPDPLVDEPLDAWLARIAQALCITQPGLQAMLGLPRHKHFSVVRDLSDGCREDLSQATGVASSTLRSMTLARWEALGLRPDTTQRGHGSGAWARSRGERHCPACLHERGGVPRLQWYLHWSFACVRHRRLLKPGQGEDTTTCERSAMWTGDIAGTLDVHHSAIAAQRAIDLLLERPSQPVQSLGDLRAGWIYLRDLAALTRMALVSAPTLDLDVRIHTSAPEHEWTEILRDCDLTPVKSPAKRLAEAIAHPGLMALATSWAHGALNAQSPEAAASTLSWLPEQTRHQAVSHARSRELSWPLVRALDHSTSRNRPGFLLGLRFGLARFEKDGRRRSPLDPAKVPASCWASVIDGHAQRRGEIGAVGVSAALLSIGIDGGIESALARLGSSHLEPRVRADWHRWFGSQDDPYFDTLLELHRVLVAEEVPINYARRRRSFEGPVDLGRNTERRVARELDAPPTSRLRRHASWYVYEMLTGSNILHTPRFLDLWAPHRLAYRRQRALWDAVRPPVLTMVAERQLLRLRIDEPVTWWPVREATSSAWTLPPPSPHVLTGWNSAGRILRTSARTHPEEFAGYRLEEAVALAVGGHTSTARRMARNMNRFVAVARSRSLREAAHSLQLSSATLSVHMSNLERDLAVELLDRSAWSVSLTPIGDRLVCLIEQAEENRRRAAILVDADTTRRSRGGAYE